jgi:hypothetical protein
MQMRIIPVLCLIGVSLITACAPDPKTLSNDYVRNPEYDTQDCIDQRQKALADDDNTLSIMNRMALILFIPFGIPIVAESDFTQNEKRKTLSRELHLACSSDPLPDDLE